ncbi:MAG: DUF4157 domain-containing protein [Nitrospira sp.]|nr:DUF4157 domain-containing protein [Nitrospira sp.]
MKAGLHLGQAGIPSFAVTPTRERMLQRACACGGSAGFSGECQECKSKKLLGGAMQAKLVINEPGDEYEQEADRVAEQVMRMPAGGADSPIRSSGALVQRRLSGEDGLLSRAAGEESTPVGEQLAADGAAPKEGTTDEGGSRCPSWRGDPESISKRAAENYVRHDITPPSQATVEKIRCEPPVANGNYGCFVHFSDGLVVRVIVRATDIVVGMGPGQISTETPPAATPLCFYDYHCPDGFLVLAKRECKSAKSSAPYPPGAPSAVVQRRVAPGQSASLVAPPMVHEVLGSAGSLLDEPTRTFFESRFGYDFGHVRVHADAAASESAQAVNALAYTVGSHVVFHTGQFDPQSIGGRRLLAHELTHVVQADAGSGGKGSMRRKADLSKDQEKAQPLPPVDCAAEITPVRDCFDLIGDMIAIQADMRENNQWLERYRNGDIPWDTDAYTARARYQGELRDKLSTKERVRGACCSEQEVPGEAPTAPSTAAPAPGAPQARPDQDGAGR